MQPVRPDTVPPEVWVALEATSETLLIEQDQLLWSPGDTRSGEAYAVLGGIIRLYHPSRERAVTLLAVSAGGLLGHHPDLHHQPYATGAEALCDSHALVLPVHKIDDWLEARDDTGKAFVSWLRARSLTGNSPRPSRASSWSMTAPKPKSPTFF